MNNKEKMNMASDELLLETAWSARESAFAWKSKTSVGCAISTISGEIATGFNIEGLFQTSIHAEVVAVTKLVEKGQKGFKIAIVSECRLFTPCGACLDWLIQFCDENSEVIIQGKDRKITKYRLIDFVPHYPIQ